MSFPESWLDIPSATSSPVLADGATPYDWLDGPTTEPSGPAPAPANLSARQAKGLGLLTSGIYGRTGSISYNNARLHGYLESRLRRLLASRGSTLFTLTWKERRTPQKLLISALRASGRRISGSDSGGWPSPMAGTPPAQASAWPTTGAKDGGKSARSFAGAAAEAERKGWANDLCTAALGTTPSGFPVETESPGQLNPAHSRWLMGYPAAWDSCGAMAMRSCRKSRRRSSKQPDWLDI